MAATTKCELREYEMQFDLLLYKARYVDGPGDFHGHPADTGSLGLSDLIRTVHLDDAPAVVANLEKFSFLKDGEVLTIELRIKHPDGRYMRTRYECTAAARLPNGRVRTVSAQVRWLGYAW